MLCRNCGMGIPYTPEYDFEFCTICGTHLTDEATDVLLQGKYGIAAEARPTQGELAEDIEQLLYRYKKGTLFAEGGTGIGKSFAYLLPSILSGNRTIISTAKKALQHQLIEKDLPFLQEKLGRKFTYALYKGAANYGCLYLAKNIKSKKERKKFEGWIGRRFRKRQSGDSAEWGGEQPVWWEDCSAKYCPRKAKCPHYDYCKPNPKHYSVLVVNHSILAIDLLKHHTPGILLGPYKFLIIDEAHQAPEMFRSSLTTKITFKGLKALRNHLINEPAVEAAIDYVGSIPSAVLRKRLSTIQEHFRFAHKYLGLPQTTPPGRESDRVVDISRDDVLGRFAHIIEECAYSGARLETSTTKIRSLVEQATSKNFVCPIAGVEPGQLANIVATLQKISQRLSNIVKVLNEICGGSLVDKVTIGDPRRTGVTPVFKSDCTINDNYLVTGTSLGVSIQPLKMAQMTKEPFEKIEAKAILSATLRFNDSFDYIQDEFGIESTEEAPVRTGVYGTPFDLYNQARLYMPKHMPLFVRSDIDNDAYLNWVQAQADEITKLVLGTRGDTLVLFASRQNMEDVRYVVKEFEWAKQGISLVMHDGDPAYALSQYKQAKHAVLFGLKSFWEGVDIKEEKLRSVIISRLPFPNPKDPLIKTLSKKAGGGRAGFKKVSVPKMVFDVKQAAGRLIRTRRDRGIVTFLDPRIWSGTSNAGRHRDALAYMKRSNDAEGRKPKGYGFLAYESTGIPRLVKDFTEAVDFANNVKDG